MASPESPLPTPFAGSLLSVPSAGEHAQAVASRTRARDTTPRILELDGVRGIAVLLVILFHYFSSYPSPPSKVGSVLRACFLMGWSGVDLFFVLSGFLIGGILLDARRSDNYFQTFYARRAYRILPLYALWIGIFFVVALGLSGHAPAWLEVSATSWTVVPVFVLFLQNTIGSDPAMLSAWLAPLWSLAVEEQFYIVMPFAIRLVTRAKLVAMLVAVSLAAPLLRTVAFVAGHPSFPYRSTLCRADALALGVLVAVIWREERWKNWIVANRKMFRFALCLLLVSVLYFAAFQPWQVGLQMDEWGMSCIDAFFAGLLLWTLLMPGGVWAALCRSSVLRSIGQVSFCMYLIHGEVNRVLHNLLVPGEPGISTLPAFAVTLLAGVAVWALARVSWRYLESPVLARGHKFQYGSAPSSIELPVR